VESSARRSGQPDDDPEWTVEAVDGVPAWVSHRARPTAPRTTPVWHDLREPAPATVAQSTVAQSTVAQSTVDRSTAGQSVAEPTRRPARRGRDAFDDPDSDEPAYRSVLGLTLAWYVIPAVLYLLWLLTVGRHRPNSSGGSIGASLPWLLAATVLSVTVAALLKWAIVGWRALTVSFAAAVIGAGVVTIAHSIAP
jgi:hypothetical protein